MQNELFFRKQLFTKLTRQHDIFVMVELGGRRSSCLMLNVVVVVDGRGHKGDGRLWRIPPEPLVPNICPQAGHLLLWPGVVLQTQCQQEVQVGLLVHRGIPLGPSTAAESCMFLCMFQQLAK